MAKRWLLNLKLDLIDGFLDFMTKHNLTTESNF